MWPHVVKRLRLVSIAVSRQIAVSTIGVDHRSICVDASETVSEAGPSCFIIMCKFAP